MVQDATYWAEQIRQKRLSPKELLQLTATKAAARNPELNAIVDWEEELIEKELTAYVPDAPFSGVPLPLKMLDQDKKGWLSTSGSRLFQNYRPQATSNFVQALSRQGFVLAGQTNAPEFGFKNVTDPVLYGPARNPWDLTRTPGGSSGGAASAVASGIFAIAAASDGGGSIRIPAGFCGLIGLKPTRGTIPVGPHGYRGWQGASINFALTVSMRDTKTLFYGMRGITPAAPYQAPPAEWQQHPRKQRLKIAYCSASPVGTPVVQAAKDAVTDAVQFLSAKGHDVTEIAYPVDGQRLIRGYYAMNGAETAAMFADIEKNLQRNVTIDDMELISWGIYQYGKTILASDYTQILRQWDRATVIMEELFQDYDVFLSPTTAQLAPKITEDLQSDALRERLRTCHQISPKEKATLIEELFADSLAITPYTQLANLTGQPAISLPTALSPEGLPVGIQVMAAKGREDILFQIGELFEAQERFFLPEYYR